MCFRQFLVWSVQIVHVRNALKSARHDVHKNYLQALKAMSEWHGMSLTSGSLSSVFHKVCIYHSSRHLTSLTVTRQNSRFILWIKFSPASVTTHPGIFLNANYQTRPSKDRLCWLAKVHLSWIRRLTLALRKPSCLTNSQNKILEQIRQTGQCNHDWLTSHISLPTVNFSLQTFKHCDSWHYCFGRV